MQSDHAQSEEGERGGRHRLRTSGDVQHTRRESGEAEWAEEDGTFKSSLFAHKIRVLFHHIDFLYYFLLSVSFISALIFILSFLRLTLGFLVPCGTSLDYWL